MISKKDFKKIGPFKGWVIENFPYIEADFDAITNYQLYCKIVEYLNKVIYNEKLLEESDNELVDAYNELEKYVMKYVTDVSDLKEAIELINTRLDDLVLKVDANTHNISLLDEKIDSEISTLDSTLRNLIDSNFDILKDYVDSQVAILNYRIDNINISNLNIYDPTTGLMSPLQTVINNLAQISNKDGLTASEFDLLELTASGFDAYQITAYEFDSSGKIILT